jgi:Ca2+-binding RTX toxin-like protein
VINVISGGDDNDVLSGSDTISQAIIGQNGADTLLGGVIRDIICGGSGNDYLDGGDNADVMIGGFGNDTYVVDDEQDVISEADNGGIDLVRSSISYVLSDHIENLTLIDFAKDGEGNSLSNIIIGNNEPNILNGLDGNDTITGRGGADIFVFNTLLDKENNLDHITDFEVSIDVIAIQNDMLKQLTDTYHDLSPGPLAAGNFYIIKPGVSQDYDDYIIYDSATGKLYYDVDGSGPETMIEFAVLDNHPAISQADIVII